MFFEKITRISYIVRIKTDAQESLKVIFNVTVKNKKYDKAIWKDEQFIIELIEHDRYHKYPHFNAYFKNEDNNIWRYKNLSNYIEAIEFLQSKKLI